MKTSLILLIIPFLTLVGCSNKLKQRQEQREKVAAASGLFCEFVSGDDHKDVDVELNFQMAKRCDANKNFTVTGYRSSADVTGLVYCCASKRSEVSRPPVARPAAPAPKAEPQAPILEGE